MLFNGRALIFTYSRTQVRIAEHERLQSLFKTSMLCVQTNELGCNFYEVGSHFFFFLIRVNTVKIVHESHQHCSIDVLWLDVTALSSHHCICIVV